ncbi:hypothetical protein [Planococcus sp. ISL-110]|uniref:hypothetical protein n=1 Tax=Planococcus sp. ISL-110 TaxID=2819167 RepID=UPI001BEA5D31|nr:hypothetical protein [Planococcus sp. ISL-110]MBT2572048.1 hypothetical protein [Planococcus sp. ISL-110]
MTAVIMKENRMGNRAKTYLEVYEEFINGYKQYKMERDAQSAKAEKVESAAK